MRNLPNSKGTSSSEWHPGHPTLTYSQWCPLAILSVSVLVAAQNNCWAKLHLKSKKSSYIQPVDPMVHFPWTIYLKRPSSTSTTPLEATSFKDLKDLIMKLFACFCLFKKQLWAVAPLSNLSLQQIKIRLGLFSNGRHELLQWLDGECGS